MLFFLFSSLVVAATGYSSVYMAMTPTQCEAVFRRHSGGLPFLKAGDIVQSPQFVDARYKRDLNLKPSVNRDVAFIVSPKAHHPMVVPHYVGRKQPTKKINIDATDATRAHSLFLVLEIKEFAVKSAEPGKPASVEMGQKVWAWRGRLNKLGEWEDTGELIEFVVGGYFSGLSLSDYTIVAGSSEI